MPISIPDLEAMVRDGISAQTLLRLVLPDLKLAQRKRAEHAKYMQKYRSERSRKTSRNSVRAHVSGREERKDLSSLLTDVSVERPVLGRSKATKLPSNWKPRPEDWEPGDQIELAKFKDHWLANGKTKFDWNATWRNWKRRALEFKPNGGQRAKAAETTRWRGTEIA